MTKTTPVIAALGLAMAGTLTAGTAGASENPFALSELDSGYMQLAASDKAGEGKCGGDMKAKEGKCGGDTKAKEGKCGEGKCGGDMKAKEGKCGGDMKAKEGKCGEGKCGGSK